MSTGEVLHEIEFGIEGAKKALQILNEHKTAGEIAVTPVEKFVFKINREAAEMQGVAPNDLIDD